MDVLLRVKDLKKGQILQGISFEMRPGEMLGVMGPLGSGEVWIGGTDICTLSEDEKAGLRLHWLGFVFQQMKCIF